MTAEERFNKRTARQIEVKFYTARTTMQSLTPEPITIAFTSGFNEHLKIWLSLEEAQALGEQLLKHANKEEI